MGGEEAIEKKVGVTADGDDGCLPTRSDMAALRGYCLNDETRRRRKETKSTRQHRGVFIMSNLSKLEFMALDISGNNYLPWVLDAEIHLDAKGLGDTIKEGNEASSQHKAKAMIFLRHHLDEGLKSEYLTLKDSFQLWTSLKERYDHLKATNNFPTKIMWGNMLEKTLSTFHASNMVLQQQYREKGFKKYSELISCILVAEQHDALLMKNHEARPTGSAPFLEANLRMIDPKSEKKRQNNYRGRINIRGRGKGRNNNRHGGGRYKQENNKGSQSNPSKGKGPMNNHDKAEANLAYKDDIFEGLADITHLEAGDFFEYHN
ncbi:PREDICTED: uncharacterized protein LOC109212595 [Nicotiana attenuata]|uniref:uncharacterized protein LOC109212595 n=1 Tax=Nicotiana attenuata TaxID=49451 RepID=UPI000905661F|nr:PREDICTED: uncharacterized protein LOC109212595 [Nicotiana attenuata]